jgi:hypothetical protein
LADLDAGWRDSPAGMTLQAATADAERRLASLRSLVQQGLGQKTTGETATSQAARVCAVPIKKGGRLAAPA